MKVPGVSLSQRLLLLTAVALLPALAILGFNEFALRNAREAEVHAYALRMSELTSLELERIITGAGALMVAVANAPMVQMGDLTECASYLDRMSVLLPQLSLLNITDLEGNSLCASSAPPEDLHPSVSESLRSKLGDRMFEVGGFTATSRGPALLLGMQHRTPTGTLDGYVLGAIGLDYLGKLLKDRPFAQGSALTIADRDGIIIAREPFPERYVGTPIPEAYQALVHESVPGTLRVMSQDGTERILGYQPATKPLGLYVSAGSSVADSFAPINQATVRGLSLAIIGGVVALLLAFGFGRRFIRRPVLCLLDTIRAWRGGDHTARTGMLDSRGEFEQVGHAIDALLDELDDRAAAQRDAEQHRDLLARELDHRVKNLLATVQAVARQTFRHADVAPELMDAFYGRLAVMADAHKLLTSQQSESADISAVVETAIGPFAARGQDRFSMAGPLAELHAKAALSLAMALHELCTNAAKYGALSNAGGTVTIDWSIDQASLTITWRERGGPKVAAPTTKGFGSRMIERAVGADLGATVVFDYQPDGLVCTIVASVQKALAGAQVAGTAPFQPVPAITQPA